jgi:DNA mismatch repair protein MutS2
MAVITTHLTQLAAAALELPGASCAAMEFDPETGRPTFRLMPGPPGGSEALALARRLGLPAEWLDRAEARLGSEHRDLRRLIAEVERLRRELNETLGRLDVDREDAEKLRRRLADELAGLEEERRTVGRRLRTELDSFRRETTERLRAEVEKMRERFEEGRRRGLEAEAVETLFATAPAFAAAGPEPAGPLVVGATVRHLGLGWQGVLEKLEPGRAEVLVKGKRVRCRPEDLGPAGSGAATTPADRSDRSDRSDRAGAPPRDPRTARRDLEDSVEIPPEVHLIGKRVEPALEELDAYIDQALLSHRKEVRVVHGHGTGRLRQAVREHLRGHPGVASVRSGAPNEGGNGATVVLLRT